jgi:hypothetical protein
MKPPYHSKGYSQYGAQMGRRSINANNYNGERLHLRQVPVDGGGYDPGGAYWGIAENLWCAYCHIDDGKDTLEIYTRAATREHAKEFIDATVGNVPAKFHR